MSHEAKNLNKERQDMNKQPAKKIAAKNKAAKKVAPKKKTAPAKKSAAKKADPLKTYRKRSLLNSLKIVKASLVNCFFGLRSRTPLKITSGAKICSLWGLFYLYA